VPDQTLIIEITMASKQLILFQSILQGEDGLGVIRCFDPEKKKQQLWTSADQKDEVYAWLNSLPPSLECRITGKWYFCQCFAVPYSECRTAERIDVDSPCLAPRRHTVFIQPAR